MSHIFLLAIKTEKSNIKLSHIGVKRKLKLVYKFHVPLLLSPIDIRMEPIDFYDFYTLFQSHLFKKLKINPLHSFLLNYSSSKYSLRPIEDDPLSFLVCPDQDEALLKMEISLSLFYSLSLTLLSPLNT